MTTLPPLYPLIFKPIYKDYLWGGDRIIKRYRRPDPPGIYAESWEISDRVENMSRVAAGPLAGRSLAELIAQYGRDLLGALGPAGRFPLLLKILDARERLSVQVHPDAESAPAVGGEPKTELWYVLEAPPGAVVYAGFKPGVTAGRLSRAIRDGTVAGLLAEAPAAAGDVIYIPGGRIHAVGAGCLLLEIAQNSDTTFRVFDWNRLGRDGRPRALQVDRALRCIRWHDPAPARVPAPAVAPAAGVILERFVAPGFRLDQLAVGATLACSTEGRGFQLLFVEEGAVQVRADHGAAAAPAGTTVLIPAAAGAYEITGQGTLARALRVSPAEMRSAPGQI